MKNIFFCALLSIAALQVNAQCGGVFYDGLETGALAPAWSIGTGHTVVVNTTAPAVGNYSMHMTGSSAFYSGPNVLFPSSQPTYVSWWINTNTVTAANGYFILGDANINSDNGVLFAYCNATSGLRFFGTTGYNHPIVANTWYHVEVMNINWTARNMDIYVNGVLILTAWPFRSTTATSIDRLHVFNLSAATASYDDITIGGVPLQLSNTVVAPLCNGAATGNIDLAVTGGAMPYTYSWSNTAITQDLTNIVAGTYTVTVTDNASCTATATITVTEPAALLLSAATTNVTCFAGTNGTADLLVSGGTPGYSYSWSSGAITQDESSLAAGTYTVVVTDGNGCNAILSGITVTEPTEIMATVAVTDIACNGGNNGSATVSPSGGVPGYTYAWSPTGGTNPTASGLTAGTYTCTITDNNGCILPQTCAISEPAAITASISATGVNCFGDTSGTAMISVSGGMPGYTYSWSPAGGTTANATGLAAGTYTVTVTDMNGCVYGDSVVVTAPTAIFAASSVTDVFCPGGADGSALVSVSGGSPGYTYAWSNGDMQAMADSLTAGTYFCTIVDANGCSLIHSVTITEPAPILINLTVTNTSTCGGTDGMIDATISGGNAPYTYAWSNGATTEDISALTAGGYTLVVTDAGGCTSQNSADVLSPPLPVVALSFATSAYCLDDANVLLSGASPAGGVWSGTGVSAGSFDPSAAGNGTHTITYTFTDANNCSASATGPLTVNACVGIMETTAGQWNIYPNPNNGIFTISTNDFSGDMLIEVLDVQGRVVFTATENNVAPGFSRPVSLEGVSTGLYMLRLYNKASSTTEIYKLSVQR